MWFFGTIIFLFFCRLVWHRIDLRMYEVNSKRTADNNVAPTVIVFASPGVSVRVENVLPARGAEAVSPVATEIDSDK